MPTVKLTELFKQNRFTSNDNNFNMRPVYVNPDFVVCLREDIQTLKMLQEGDSSLPEGLDSRHEFTKLHINSGNSSFDITIALGVLDYIENASEFINKMDKLTSKVSVVSWPENGLRMALRRYRYTCPVFHYSKQDIIDLYSDCQLSNLQFIKSRGGWVTIGYK